MEKIKAEVMELYASFGEGVSSQTRVALVEACASIRLALANERLAIALSEALSKPIVLETTTKLSGELSHKDVRVEVKPEPVKEVPVEPTPKVPIDEI